MVIVNKKKFIRACFILFAPILGIIVLIILLSGKTEEKKVVANEQQSETTKQIISEKTPTSFPTTTIPEEWNLKLVNKNYSIEKDYQPDLVTIEGELKFDKRAISYLEDMMNAIRKAGITKIWIQSAYRSYEKQEKLFNDKVNYYVEKGNSKEEAEKLAQTVVQRPEQSEHNLGLAVDLNNVTNDFEKTKAFTWLQQHAKEYGFILRYPKDKQEITGVSYESWHWRYVGKEHAQIMKEKEFCLEEYIQYLEGKQEV